MLESAVFSIAIFLIVMLMVYLWASLRNLIRIRALDPQEYLWRLKQITGQSEYEIFHIAAGEKGWPDYQVERHFKRYLQDQTIPAYVKEFLEDGKEYIDAYRPERGKFLNKRVLIFYSLFTLLMIGGSFIFCLYIYPRIHYFGFPGGKAIPKFARPHIYQAILFADNRQYEEACLELERACELGYCEHHNKKKREGVCQ
jgi:hypothetical protein